MPRSMRRARAAVAVGAVCAASAALAACSDAADTRDRADEEPTASAPSAAGPPEDLSAAESQPVDDPYYPHNGEPYLDTLHYDLELDWDPAGAGLRGTAEITFRVTEPRDDIRLDFGEPLEAKSAKLDGAAVKTRKDADDLVIATGNLRPEAEHTLTIAYEGEPEPVPSAGSRSDLTKVGWTTEGDGSVWTMQEPWGAYTWYPVNDHPSDKAYYSATVTTHDGMTGVFNGQLADSRSDGDSTTTTWSLDEPAASYLTTIAIGDYAVTEDEGPDGLALTYWTRPDDDQLLPILEETPEMLEWLIERLGPYPFDSGGAVVVPSNSAMETQTMVTMGTSARPLDDEYRAVLVHEYAHQWLGNTVTPNNWKDLWLNEGLTMYIQALWSDEAGLRPYDGQISEWASLDNANRRLYGAPGEYDKGEFASINVYTSGAVMLDRIREEVGAEAFDEALRSWPQEHRNVSADRTDFIEHMSQATGADLEPFVRKWLTAERAPSTVS